jgi:hypothetical protein
VNRSSIDGSDNDDGAGTGLDKVSLKPSNLLRLVEAFAKARFPLSTSQVGSGISRFKFFGMSNNLVLLVALLEDGGTKAKTGDARRLKRAKPEEILMADGKQG